MSLLDDVRTTCSIPTPDAATTLPPDAYRSAELFGLERDRLFRAGWMAICRVDDVAEPGSYYSVDLLQEPLVVTRARDGAVHVLSRTCRHRWMEVAEGRGRAHALQCPYHLWTYSLDGRLVGAPEMHGAACFNADELCLPHVRHEVWNGFVVVNLDGNAAPLAPRLAALDELVANYEVEGYRTVERTDWGRCPWDWKIMVDNFMECYHHLGPHRGSLQDEFPGEMSWTDRGADSFSFMHIPQAPGYPASAPFLSPGSAKLRAAQYHENVIFTVYPCFMVSIGPAFMYWLKVLPAGAGEIDLQLDICMSGAALQGDDLDFRLRRLVDGIVQIHKEDIDVCTKVQRAVSSGATHVGPLSLLEQPLWEFYRYIGHGLGLLSEHTPVAAAG
jgi:phenylpropionate dioxygenase-like ring-hydroxylating dioxygenase large terminal subunit